MVMEFYACKRCHTAFFEHDDYFVCDCGAVFCGYDCGSQKYKHVGDNTYETCVFCRFEDASPDELYKAALKRLGFTRTAFRRSFLKEKKAKNAVNSKIRLL